MSKAATETDPGEILDWSDGAIMDEPLPVIPDAASQAILTAVAQVQAAQQNVTATVGLVLATLGLSIQTHDVEIEGGRAVVKPR